MKSRARMFPAGVFLAAACVIAVIICAFGCFWASRGGFAFWPYAAVLFCASIGGGLIVALSASRSYGALAREAARAQKKRFSKALSPG